MFSKENRTCQIYLTNLSGQFPVYRDSAENGIQDQGTLTVKIRVEVFKYGDNGVVNRDTNLVPFGSPDYSREELVAEMSAAFLCATCGISPPTIDQSASYIDHWRKQLKGDKKLIIQAAGAAQKSADWILGTKFNQSSNKPDTISARQPVDQKPNAVTSTTAARTQLELF